MALRDMITFNTAVEKIQGSVKNIQAISAARKRNQQEQELFNINKKKAQLELDAMEASGKMDEFMRQTFEEGMKPQIKQQQDVIKAKETLINTAYGKEQQSAQQNMTMAKQLFESSDEIQGQARASLGYEDPQRQMSVAPQQSMGQVQPQPAEQTAPMGALDRVQQRVKEKYGERYWFNPKTRGIEEDPKFTTHRENRLEKNQQFINSTRIRQEFINRPEVKEFITIKTAARSMDSLLDKAIKGDINNRLSLDQALITMFNKMTDPQSVVRESEYARTPQNLPIINQLTGAIQKVAEGGAGLTDADRKALVWGAKVITNERGRTYNETLDEYLGLASEYNLDPALVTRGIEPHEDFQVDSGIYNKPAEVNSLDEQMQRARDAGYSEDEIQQFLQENN